MARLIDADALMKELKDFCDWCRDGRKQGTDFVLDCVIPNAPTIDAVPVIRCKDCKHRPTIDGEWENGFDVIFPDGRCPCQCDDGWYNWMPRDDWFCGNGERKEE